MIKLLFFVANIGVTDAELRHSLNIVRQLKDDKVTSYGRASFSSGFFSKYNNRKVMFKNFSELNLKQYDALFLVSDEANEFGIKKKLKNALLPTKDQWKLFRDKGETIKFAKKVGVPVPETKVIYTYEDDFEYPVFLKPAESSGSRGSRLITSKFEMRKVLPKTLREHNKVLVQEFIRKKTTVGVEALYHKGKLKGLFQHQRIREYPVKGGPSTLRVSVNYKKTKELAEKLLKGAKWNGVAMVEFALTDKGPVLFEVNPRWWGSLALPIKAGVNFPKLYRDILIEGDCETVTTYDSNVLCKYFWFGDVMHFVSSKNPIGFVKSLFETRNFDILSLRDPLPGLSRFFFNFELLFSRGLRHRYLRR